MIEYYGENPAANQSPWAALFKTIAILRIGTGVLLLTQYGITAVLSAYDFYLYENGWSWLKLFVDAGIPNAHLVAPAVAVVVAAVGVSWTLGFVTRFFAVVFLPLIVTTLVILHRAGSVYVETAWLYTLISVTLLLFGSGAISLDKLFNIGQRMGGSKSRR